MIRLVADVGNSRVKWGRVGPDGTIETSGAIPLNAVEGWSERPADWGPVGVTTTWRIASVNPPGLDRFIALIRQFGDSPIQVLRSAAEIPLSHDLATPETTGVDRALGVLAALARHPKGGPGQVISCGTAITVERIGSDGVWFGGAILPGLGPTSDALRQHTARLPKVEVDAPPRPWGNTTEPAIAAGIYWGLVGGIREVLTRQAEDFDHPPWRVWTGGDARLLADGVEGPSATILPHLVLEALARLPFPEG